MSWLASPLFVLDMTTSTVEFAVNWLLQSSILLVAGLSIGRLLRGRGSAVQSAIYRTTLIAALVCPLATWGLSRAGVSGWSVRLPAAYRYDPAEIAEVSPPVPIAADDTPASLDTASVPDAPSRGFDDSLLANRAKFNSPESTALDGTPSYEPLPIAEATDELSVAPPRELSVQRYAIVALMAAVIWLFISLALTGRLFFAWRRLAQLRHHAVHADANAEHTCRELASLLRVSAPEVLRSPYVPSPCLFGLRRPAVLLPDGEVSLPLRDVLIHELAHLKRRDCHWNLLRQVATSFFFYQPLLWKLSRLLELTAEDVCDDYVVELGGDRRDYAHRLVDVAELSALPIASAGVGIVSLRSMLARRVARIMDTSRALSTRVGSLLLVAVLAGGLVGTTLVGLVGLNPTSSQADVRPDDQIGATQTTESDAEKAEPAAHDRADPAQEESVVKSSIATVSAPFMMVDGATGYAGEEFFGTVIGADGRPVAGAKIYWLRTRIHDTDPMTPRLIATSNPSGEYRFKMPSMGIADDAPASWMYQQWIVVRAPGHGFAVPAPGAMPHSREIKLPTAGDPIRGRLVDMDGQPVGGATVRIRWFTEQEQQIGLREEKIRDPEHAEWRARLTSLLGNVEPANIRAALPTATSDPDGRFELRDLGHGRLFQLLVEGEQIESTQILARNEPGDVIEVSADRHTARVSHKVYAREFLHVVGPSRPVLGRVLDADDKTPIANAIVRAVEVHGQHLMSSRKREHFTTRTDGDGLYRITGLPVGDGNGLVALTNGDVPYIPSGHQVDTSGPRESVSQDFLLSRGVWAEGRVFDADSDKPLVGQISYYYFPDPDLEKSVPGLRNAFVDGAYWTNVNGQFRAPVLPTRGILAFRYAGRARDRDGTDRYPRGYGAASIEGAEDQGGLLAFPTRPYYLMPINYTRVVEVHPAAGQSTVRADMPLSMSQMVTTQVVDPDGRPVTDYQVYGASQNWGWRPQQASQFDVQGLKPKERRKVFVYHHQRDLVGWAIVEAAQAGDAATIKLQPAGRVTGRLVDEDGVPITDASLNYDLGKLQTDEQAGIWAPHPELRSNPTNIPVDREGRFRLDGLVAGLNYGAWVVAPRKMQGQIMDMSIGRAIDDVTVVAGETIDLGDVHVTRDQHEEPQRAKQKAANNETTDVRKVTMRGRVVDEADRPIPGATVAVTRSKWNFGPGQVEHQKLQQVVADAKGQFEVELTLPNNDASNQYQISHSKWRPADLVASAPGYGVVWVPINDGPYDREVVMRLEKRPAPIRGRLVSLEGQPLPGLRVRVRTLAAAKPDQIEQWLDHIKSLRSTGKLPKPGGANMANMFIVATVASGMEYSDRTEQRVYYPEANFLATGHPMLPPPVTTDDQGRFELSGLSPNQKVTLEISGPGVALQDVTVVNRAMQPLTIPNARYYGATFDHPVAPGIAIKGVVKDVESGAPLVGVMVMSFFGADMKPMLENRIVSVTDGQGRFRLAGMPVGKGNSLKVVPRDQPYLITDNLAVPDGDGSQPIEMEIGLRRGVFISGRVTDVDSGEPVNASVHFHPFLDNPHAEDFQQFGEKQFHGDLFARSGLTQKDGSYRIVGVPGRGILAAMVSEPGAYCVGLGADQIEGLSETQQFPTFEFCSPKIYNRLIELDIPAERKEISRDLEVSRGGTVVLQPVDSAGRPLDGVKAGNRTPLGGDFRDSPDEGAVEIVALRPDEKRDVVLLHKARRLAAVVTVESPKSGTKRSPEMVTLLPCASVIGRLVNEDGDPVDGMQLYATVVPSAHMNIVPEQSVAAEDGSFRFQYLPSGQRYQLIGHGGPSVGFFELIDQLTLEPGETVDLGTMDVTSDERPQPIRKKAGENPNQSSQSTGTGKVREEAMAAGEAQASEPGQSAANVLAIRGKVVDPDGKPVAGAKVLLPDNVSAEAPSTMTDEDGQFSIEFDKAKFTEPPHNPEPWRHASLYATAEPFAPAWTTGDALTSGDAVTLQLKRDEVPIRGQILNLEGAPVPEAELTLSFIHEPYGGNLDGWLEQLRDSPRMASIYMNREFQWFPAKYLNLEVDRGEVSRGDDGGWVIRADSEGRFEFRGIGEERVVHATVAGTDIESLRIKIITRSAIADKWKRRGLTEQAQMMLDTGSPLPQAYGAKFKHFAAPSYPIRGTVRARDTGEPLAGVTVTAWARGTDNHADATTDEDGRYELTGLTAEGTLNLIAGPKDQANVPYVGGEREEIALSATSPPTSEHTDFDLVRGILVRGSVTDADTGQPVRARVEYLASGKNPLLEELTYGIWPYAHAYTTETGEFVIAVPPGPGALAVWTRLYTPSPNRYRPIAAADFGLPVSEDGWVNTTNLGDIRGNSYEAARFVDFQPGDKPAPIALTVKRMFDIARVRCVDEQGRIATDVAFAGHLPRADRFPVLFSSGLDIGRGDKAYVEIAGLAEPSRRPVVIRHFERGLAAILYPSHDQRQPRLADLPRDKDGAYRLALGPGAAIRGRLVDADGTPIRSQYVNLYLLTNSSPSEQEIELAKAFLDDEGQFEILHAPAGGPFRIAGGSGDLRGRVLKPELMVGAGEQIELGELSIDIEESQNDDP